MSARRRLTGSRLLGEELRRLRGTRSLEEVARLSRTLPHADRVEPIAYSTLSMIERGVTMPSAQSLLTLAAIYRVPAQRLLDLVALERYHARKPGGEKDAARLERSLQEDLRSGRNAEAYSKALRLQELARELGGDESAVRRREAGARLLAGLALWKMGWLVQAAAAFRELVNDLDAEPSDRAWACQNLVEVERQTGLLASARAHARDGLELAERLADARLRGTFHGTLANLERDLAERERGAEPRRRHLDAALSHHASCRELATQVGDRFLLVHDLLNEAVTRGLAGESGRAAGLLEDGLRRAEIEGFGRLVAFGRLERGKLLLAEGRPADARRELRAAERQAAIAEAGDLSFLSWFYLLRCALELDEDPSEAWRRCRSLSALQESALPELDELERLERRAEVAQ